MNTLIKKMKAIKNRSAVEAVFTVRAPPAGQNRRLYIRGAVDQRGSLLN